MIVSDVVLEFAARFARTAEFLEASTTRLADFHRVGASQVSLAGVRASIHLLSHGWVVWWR